jgi:two-component system nitrogen regulation response regulator NtrX
VRELRNTVERALIMAIGDPIDVPELASSVRVDSRTSALDNGGERPGTLREFKETAERAFLVEKLRANEWNISKTAEGIGTPRSNLYKKLEQYSISKDTDG